MNSRDLFDTERIVTTTNETIQTKSIKDSFKNYSSKINWTVFILICFFTLGIACFRIFYIVISYFFIFCYRVMA